MVFGVFLVIVLLKTNVRKEYEDKSVFCHCYGNFVESAIRKVTWPQLCQKFVLKNSEAHWKQQFERNPTVEDFKDIDQDMH